MQSIYHVHWDVGAHAAFSRTFVLSSNLGSTNNVRDRNSCLSLRKLFCLFRQSLSQWTEQFCSVDRVHWKACLLFLSFSDRSCPPLYYRQSGDEWAVLSGINCWLTPKVEGRLSRYETCKNLHNTSTHSPKVFPVLSQKIILLNIPPEKTAQWLLPNLIGVICKSA